MFRLRIIRLCFAFALANLLAETLPAQNLPAQNAATQDLSSAGSFGVSLGTTLPLFEARRRDVFSKYITFEPDVPQPPQEPLPPLEEELWMHGGSYLYSSEGDRLNWPSEEENPHYDYLRLPEDWKKPLPLTLMAEFQGADAIREWPRLKWPGTNGYYWEPRFVGYGSYSLFAFALEQDNQRQDVIGHQAIFDLDLQLTGTERFHVQFRPVGENGSGGSYYQFNEPNGFIDNSHTEPDRYWFEGELHSLLGGFLDPFAVRDYQFTAGKFAYGLHNSLLINDEILGVVVNKNTIYVGDLSNLNVQLFYGFNDVGTFSNADAQLYGGHLSADYKKVFYEATYAYAQHEFDRTQDSQFAALSRTKLRGPLTMAARALFKWGDEGGSGDGQLFVLENSFTRYFESQPLGFEYGVFYANAFYATEGWNSMGGANYNRLRTAFEVNPLVRIGQNPVLADTWGVSLGVHLFRCHEDQGLIPEIAYEEPGGVSVWGFGLRYQRKTGPRSYFEVLGMLNISDDPQFDREGVFLSETIVF